MKAGTISCYCITWCLTREIQSQLIPISMELEYSGVRWAYFWKHSFFGTAHHACTTCRALMHILLNMQAYTIEVCQLCCIVSDIGLSLSGRCGDWLFMHTKQYSQYSTVLKFPIEYGSNTCWVSSSHVTKGQVCMKTYKKPCKKHVWHKYMLPFKPKTCCIMHAYSSCQQLMDQYWPPDQYRPHNHYTKPLCSAFDF